MLESMLGKFLTFNLRILKEYFCVEHNYNLFRPTNLIHRPDVYTQSVFHFRGCHRQPCEPDSDSDSEHRRGISYALFPLSSCIFCLTFFLLKKIPAHFVATWTCVYLHVCLGHKSSVRLIKLLVALTAHCLGWNAEYAENGANGLLMFMHVSSQIYAHIWHHLWVLLGAFPRWQYDFPTIDSNLHNNLSGAVINRSIQARCIETEARSSGFSSDFKDCLPGSKVGN